MEKKRWLLCITLCVMLLLIVPYTAHAATTKTTYSVTQLTNPAKKTYQKALPVRLNRKSTSVYKSDRYIKTTKTTSKYITYYYTKNSRARKNKVKTVVAIKKIIAYYKDLTISNLAPKADARVVKAFQTLGFTVKADLALGASGCFSAKDRYIKLRHADDTCVYHELGHFVSFVSGNMDSTTKFQKIYKEEKEKYSDIDKTYAIHSASEYYAACYQLYVLHSARLKKEQPKTFAYIQSSIKKITDTRINSYKSLYK